MLKDIPSKIYDAISFNKGSKPDFELLGSSFIEQGIFINNKGESPVIKSVPDYATMIDTNIGNGNIISIKETEIRNNVQVFGNVAQICSEYELIFEGKGGVQTRYGVNLFQLINQQGTWLVSSMCWDDKVDKSLLTKIAQKAPATSGG